MIPTIAFDVINRFLEDTCVITALAFVISRAPLLPKLFDVKRRLRDVMALALVFALAGASEMIFPGERYPYVTFTLMSSFAGYAGGSYLGLLTAAIMLVTAVVGRLSNGSHFALPLYACSILVACLFGIGAAMIRMRLEVGGKFKAIPVVPFLALASISGGAGEAFHRFLMHTFITGLIALPVFDFYAICANSFGSLILGLVMWDAHQRYLANEHRVRIEKEVASLRLNQLTELQARLHPHFLFNALAGLAGLCVIDPGRAERGIADLGALLRQFLRMPDESVVALREEVETVRTYIAIEQLRLENRMRITESFPDELLSWLVPRFALQIPVENALQHGVAACHHFVNVAIVARRRGDRLALAVFDSGPGNTRATPALTPASSTNGERLHGLTLLRARLQLAYGESARLRLFRHPGRGAACVVWIPANLGVNRNEGKTDG